MITNNYILQKIETTKNASVYHIITNSGTIFDVDYLYFHFKFLSSYFISVMKVALMSALLRKGSNLDVN